MVKRTLVQEPGDLNSRPDSVATKSNLACHVFALSLIFLIYKKTEFS